MSDIFEIAARRKLRFDTPKGPLTVEDLWSLPLERGVANLEDIAKGLHGLLKSDADVSFVRKEKKADPTVQLKFDIVVHIINTRVAEDEARATREADAAWDQKVLSIIKDREEESLRTLPLEELRALRRPVKG